MNILLQFSPNNEVRLSLQSLNPRTKQLRDCLPQRESEKYARLIMASQVEVARGFSAAAILNTGGSPNNVIVSHSEADATEAVRARSLDIIKEVQQANKMQREKRKNAVKSGWGKAPKDTRFGRNARRRIISAGSILERRCSDPSCSVLVTCTLPGDSPGAVDGFARWSGYTLNRCLQRVRAAFSVAPGQKRDGLSWFYCWEFQARGALHLHLCLWTNDAALTEHLGYVFKKSWEAVLRDLSVEREPDLCTKRNGRSCWLPAYWQNDVSVVRTSVARYVSKYASKSAAKSPCWNRRYTHPSRWWGMDRLLNQEVRRESPEIKARSQTEARATGLLTLLIKEIQALGIVQSYHWTADIGSGEYHAGWASCHGFYLADDIFLSAREWLLELFTRSIADIDFSLLEYRNYDPLPVYSSEVCNKLLVKTTGKQSQTCV